MYYQSHINTFQLNHSKNALYFSQRPPVTTFLKFVDNCVDKIPWPNVVCKFGVFYHKKWNASFYQYPVPQKLNFCRWWRPLKKLHKICIGDSDNNEYLAVKYIRCFTNDITCLSCNASQWAETMTWKWSDNTELNSLVKQHQVAWGMQVSKKKTCVINS